VSAVLCSNEKNTKTEEDSLNLRTLKLNSTQEKRKKALPLLRNTAHRIAPLPISLSLYLSLSLSLSSSSVLVGARPNANETRRRYTQLNSTQLNSTQLNINLPTLQYSTKSYTMLGLINDCTEQLVITKFGLDAWHTIKENAKCDVKDYGFISHGHYPDSATVDLVVAASELLKVDVDDVLELFGQFFLQYTIDKGYDNLLRCQGSNLRLWLSNLNAMHAHLQSAMPAGNFPVFWCENCIIHEGTIILHYYSIRGALLSGVVVGIVKEVAKVYFDVEIHMDKLAIQDETIDQQCTTWRISSIDPKMSYKLTNDKIKRRSSTKGGLSSMTGPEAIHMISLSTTQQAAQGDDDMSHSTANSFSSMPMTCPFTGAGGGPVPVPVPAGCGRDSSGRTLTSLNEEEEEEKLECPFDKNDGNDCVPSSRSIVQQQDESSSTRSLNVTSDEGKMLMGKLIKRSNSIENLRKLAAMNNGGAGAGDGGDSGNGADNATMTTNIHAVLEVASSSPTTTKVKKTKKKKSSSKLSKTKNAAIVAKISKDYTNGLPSSMVCSIFPYHVVSTVL
jgi:hypothetical protein